LATGDTVALSARSEVLQALGNIDEVISSTEESTIEITGETVALEYFDDAVAEEIRAAAVALPEVDGAMPVVLEEVGAQNPVARQTEPRLSVIGISGQHMEGFGTVRNVQGEAIDLVTLQQNEVLLNREAAEELDAAVGDMIVLFSTTGQKNARVRDIIRYDGMATADAGVLM
jgi:ABC-type lipoprotein release transport system permease subunit